MTLGAGREGGREETNRVEGGAGTGRERRGDDPGKEEGREVKNNGFRQDK